MSAFKKATQRITAVAASAVMATSAAFGAGLSNYPNNFDSSGVTVVYGAAGAASDMTAAQSIIDSLQSEGETTYKVTGSKFAGGGESISVTRSNTKLNYGEIVGNVSEQSGFDDSDADVLADGTFNNDISDEDYTQTLTLKNGTFNYALRDEVDGIDEIVDGIFYSNGDTFAEYVLEMDSSISLSGSDFDEDLIGNEIIIMGNEFTVADVSKSGNNTDELILVGGSNKLALGEGETSTVSVDGTNYEISVQSVSSGGEVLMTVNGDSRAIDEYDTEDVGGVTIAVTELVEGSDHARGYAQLVIGGQKVSLKAGDVQINDEEVDDIFEDIEIDVAFSGTGLEVITITYSVDDDTLLRAGESLDDVLFNAFSIVYEGTNEPEYSTIEVRVNDDDISIKGTTEDGEAFNRDFLHMGDKTNATSAVWVVGEQDSDRIFHALSANLTSAGVTPTLNPNVGVSGVNASFDLSNTNVKGSGFLLEEDSEEQYLYEISSVDTSDADHEVDFEEFLRSDDENDIKRTEWGTDLGTTFTVTNSTVDVNQIAFGQLGDEIAFENEMILTLLSDTEVASIASTSNLDFRLDDSDVEADDDYEESDGVRLSFSRDANDDEFDISAVSARNGASAGAFINAGNEDNEGSSSDIQTFVTKYGIMVEYDNEEETYAIIKIPEEQVEARASIIFGSGATENVVESFSSEDAANERAAELEDDGYSVDVTEMTSEAVDFDVSAVTMDGDVSGTDDMIVVGGPAVNKVAATLLGVTYPAYGTASGLSEGDAEIRYFSDSNSVLVYGWDAAGTTAAAARLNAGGLSGDTVNVS